MVLRKEKEIMEKSKFEEKIRQTIEAMRKNKKHFLIIHDDNKPAAVLISYKELMDIAPPELSIHLENGCFAELGYFQETKDDDGKENPHGYQPKKGQDSPNAPKGGTGQSHCENMPREKSLSDLPKETIAFSVADLGKKGNSILEATMDWKKLTVIFNRKDKPRAVVIDIKKYLAFLEMIASFKELMEISNEISKKKGFEKSFKFFEEMFGV